MRFHCLVFIAAATGARAADGLPPAFPAGPEQALERTCFQVAGPWSAIANVPADVAIVYGIDKDLPARVKTWRDRGYRVQMMTGASWGEYYDYFDGKWDGVNHEGDIQTVASGRKMGHPGGGGGYYMCPTVSFGEYLWQGIKRGLDAGVEAVHLEESEYWAKCGYSEAFKREWSDYYHEAWMPPQGSVDAEWRGSKLKYFLFRRVLQQIFRHVKEYNRDTGRNIRCYVPTHSLLNYAHWRIISGESSLADIPDCDGYIGQPWTGSTRVPNRYQSELTTWNDIRERPFDTAFLEYGAMANFTQATGRRMWVNGDPVEDDPKHDWPDYRFNWEATLTGALFQPDIIRHEILPWPERVFGGVYPAGARPEERHPIPAGYATELQVVMHALSDLDQRDVSWDSGTRGLGVLVSDSLMFEREVPSPSDPDLSQFYGLALPLLKRGVPVKPVQLEYVPRPGFLAQMKVLFLTYDGQKPLSAEVHDALAAWVRAGGVLVVVDDDRDPYNHVREWWNDQGRNDRTPRGDLFARLGVSSGEFPESPCEAKSVGKGAVYWARESPVAYASTWSGSVRFADLAATAVRRAGLTWTTASAMVLRRGPYVIAAGLDESPIGGAPKVLKGHFVNLFDPELRVQESIQLSEGVHVFLRDLDAEAPGEPKLLAAAGKAQAVDAPRGCSAWAVEGVGNTQSIILLRSARRPTRVDLDGHRVEDVAYDDATHVSYIRFAQEARPRLLTVVY
jgi:hypothetical protein